MKKYIYSVIAFFTILLCTAQTVAVSQAEYFWDTDPGEGNATAIVATDGSFDTAFEQLSKAGIAAPAVGLHTFNIRIKDNTGAWSPVFTNVINVEQTLTPTPISLSQAEYFWDTDPGEGNATAILATDGNFDSAFEQLSKSGIAAPAVGLHTFNIRVKDNSNVWGTVFTNVINVEQTLAPTPISITQAEYFWDTDPGEGSGIPLLATDGNLDSAFGQFFQNGISIAQPAGLHVFNVRIKDNTGIWSPVFKNVIYIESTLASENFSVAHLIVYPNPVKDLLTLSFENEITTVAIYNMLGQEVLTKSIFANEGQMDVSGLRTGTYLVKIYAGNQVKTIKVIKE